MINRKLRIGRIPYANLFPIFYALERVGDCSAYEFVEGVPSRLNRMLRDGMVDVSPSSSIEYLRYPSFYRIVEGHSISSRGPVGSIFLFSERPIEELGGADIAVTSQSETSVALLSIILKKFYGLRCTLTVTDDPENSGKEAFLLIGDDALKYGAGVRKRASTEEKNFETAGLPVFRACGLMMYDLGDIWYNRTGLPFVFALWIMRPEARRNKKLFDKFLADLEHAKEYALQHLLEIAKHAPARSFMSEEDILDYWNKLDYELTEDHKKGLDLFGKYIKELKL